MRHVPTVFLPLFGVFLCILGILSGMGSAAASGSTSATKRLASGTTIDSQTFGFSFAAAGNTLFFFYDASGNVTEAIDQSGNLRAEYVYGSFGSTIYSSGDLAEANTYRYSTKPQEIWADDTYYYGLRFYDPGLGRWLNRDPLGERGGINLYAMLGNDAEITVPGNHSANHSARYFREAFRTDEWKWFAPRLA